MHFQFRKTMWMYVLVYVLVQWQLWSCSEKPATDLSDDTEVASLMQHWDTISGRIPLHWRLRLYTSPDKYFACIGEAECITGFPGDDSHRDWQVRFNNGEELLMRCFVGSDPNVHLATSVVLFPSVLVQSDGSDWTSITWLEGVFHWGMSEEEVEELISWRISWKTTWENPLVEECSYVLSPESDPIKRVVTLIFTEGRLSAVQFYMENTSPRAGNKEGRHFEGDKLLRYIGILPGDVNDV